MREARRRWLAAVIAIGVAGCTCREARGPSDDDPGTSGAEQASEGETAIELEALRFERDATEARLHRLREHVVGRTDGWRHLGLERISNLVRERWCSPQVRASSCDGGAVVRGEPGTAWYELGTYHYPKDWPRVFGLKYRAGHVPEDDGWGIGLSVVSGARSVSGEGVGVTLFRVEDGEIADEAHVGSRYEYRIEQTRFAVDAPVEDALGKLLASPESLRDAIVAELEALEAEVLSGVEAHEVRKCEYGPYEGGGVPPECERVPLTAREEAAALEQAERALDERVRLAREHHARWHALLVDALPPAVWDGG